MHASPVPIFVIALILAWILGILIVVALCTAARDGDVTLASGTLSGDQTELDV